MLESSHPALPTACLMYLGHFFFFFFAGLHKHIKNFFTINLIKHISYQSVSLLVPWPKGDKITFRIIDVIVGTQTQKGAGSNLSFVGNVVGVGGWEGGSGLEWREVENMNLVNGLQVFMTFVLSLQSAFMMLYIVQKSIRRRPDLFTICMYLSIYSYKIPKLSTLLFNFAK